MEPVKASCTGRQFGRMNVAIDPESGFVDVGACAFACDHQNPNGAVFMAQAQFAQFNQIRFGLGKILKQLRELGVLVEAIEFRFWQLGVGLSSLCHGDVQISVEQAISITSPLLFFE